MKKMKIKEKVILDQFLNKEKNIHKNNFIIYKM